MPQPNYTPSGVLEVAHQVREDDSTEAFIDAIAQSARAFEELTGEA